MAGGLAHIAPSPTADGDGHGDGDYDPTFDAATSDAYADAAPFPAATGRFGIAYTDELASLQRPTNRDPRERHHTGAL